MNLQVPKKLSFGGGDLVELSYLEQTLGIKRRTAAKYLSVLHIKPMYIGKDIFFSLTTFKRIMYILSLPGSPGFLFPGSAGRYNIRLLEDNEYIKEVTPEILKQAADPKVPAYMAAASGNSPAILKQLLREPVGRPHKEKK